jgi:signal transduction histidine kinase
MSTTDRVDSAPRTGYGALWRTMPRELLYLMVGFPLSTIGFSVTIGLFSAGVGTIFTFFIGVVLIIACLYVARGFGTVDVHLLAFTGRPRIRKPDWQDARARTGFFGWLRAVLGNGHYWLYLLHTMLVAFVVATVTFSIAVTWAATALGGLTYWFWGRFLPTGDRDFRLSDWFVEQVLGMDVRIDSVVGDIIFYSVLGVVFALTLPLVTRGLVWVHWSIGRGLLGAWRSDALEREVATLSEQRGAAQSAEGHSLRRLERDIHDGPQQRLVRLQMDLAAAERQLDSDPERARGLIEEAMQQSKDALEELRALSRGFAPPILLDRGLVAALQSAAVRSTIPTRIVDELPDGLSLPQEIERNAYFAASEALVNAQKHSGATSITIRVAVRRVPETDQTWLDVVVTDDGHGGAIVADGHGIAGLRERMRGLGGTLEVDSPIEGPTSVAAHLPLTTVTGSTTSVA